MRIAIVTHKLVRGDGQGRVNLEVAAAALRRGWQLTLLAREVAPELLASDKVQWIPIEVRGWPTELLRNQVFAFRSWRWLARHRQTIDLLCVNGFITWAQADLNAAHYVHSAWLASPYRPRTRWWSLRSVYHHAYSLLNARLERAAYRRSRVVVAVSEQVRGHLLAIGVQRHRTVVIPNGVDTTEFHPASLDERSECAATVRPLTGIFIGDLRTPRKNLDTVLRALLLCPEVHLAVVGDVVGSPYPERATMMGLRDRVHFLGFRRDVPRLLRTADFTLAPSLYEPSGLVLFESLASAVPVITAASVGGVEIIDDRCSIVIPDPMDVRRLAGAIQSLAASAELRQTMGAAGRQLAMSLDFSGVAERYCELMRSVGPAAPCRAGTEGQLRSVNGSS